MKTKTFIAPSISQINIIGVGGTGSFLAQQLAKMISGYKLNIDVELCDHDVVEEKNCARQNFLPYEIGENKAEVLAFRLNQQFGTSFGSSTERITESSYHHRHTLIISCVDNLKTRKLLNDSYLWLDMGNEESHGQAIFGTTSELDKLHNELSGWNSNAHVVHLPNPYLVTDLENRQDSKKKSVSCADHPFNEQGIYVNEYAALAASTILFQLLIKGIVETPAIYFNSVLGQMLPAKISEHYYSKF